MRRPHLLPLQNHRFYVISLAVSTKLGVEIQYNKINYAVRILFPVELQFQADNTYGALPAWAKNLKKLAHRDTIFRDEDGFFEFAIYLNPPSANLEDIQ